MFHKRATFSLTVEHVLNEPVLPDFMVRQDTGFNKTNLTNTIKSIKIAHKVIDSDGRDFDLEAEIKKHPDSLYVKCFAIKADEPNDNGDYFSREELIKATSTFVGVPIFTNHANQDINQARGKVVHSWWDDSRNGIMIIARVDSHAYPQLARGIKQDYVTSTSMGASRGHDMVSMSDGTKKRVDEIQIGDTVLTHSGSIEPVTAILETQEHSQLYHIRWNGNKNGLALSYEHPVLIIKREDIYTTYKSGRKHRKKIKSGRESFVPASEVKSGDYVLELIDATENETNITEDQAFLLGVYAAEGYVCDGFVGFCFGTNDPLIDKTIAALKKVTNGKITEIEAKDRNGHYVRVHDTSFAEFCSNSFGKGSHFKKPSVEIMRLPKKIQKIIIGSYIDGDGCQIRERTLKNGHSSGKGAIQCSSASIDLLRGIRKMLLRIGVSSTLSSHERIARSSTVMDKNTKYVEHMLYLSNSCHDVLKPYSMKVSSSDAPVQPKSDSFFIGPYIAHRVRDVVTISNSEPTYYMQIGELEDDKSDHSYILNDIATHNCAVHHSLCSICHNYAETPAEYCTHIANTKTRMVSAKKVKCAYHKHGKEEECPICRSKKNDSKTFDVEKKAFEYNYGIKFIENSFVVNPACHECGVVEVIDPTKLRARITQIADRLPSLIKAAQQDHFCSDTGCFKVAGQDQLNRLNQAIELLSSVSSDMLKQKDQIDLEFLTDLVKVLADLQAVTDELNQQGYGRLPSPTDSATSPAAPATTTPTDSSQPQPTPTTPVNPTPGGGSKIHSGPAGGAGTFTGPLASKEIKLEKIGSIIAKSKDIMINIKLMRDKAIRPNLRIVNNSKSIF